MANVIPPVIPEYCAFLRYCVYDYITFFGRVIYTENSIKINFLQHSFFQCNIYNFACSLKVLLSLSFLLEKRAEKVPHFYQLQAYVICPRRNRTNKNVVCAQRSGRFCCQICTNIPPISKCYNKVLIF